MKKFTVITICLNVENDIGSTIASVLHQTSSDFEYIIKDGLSNEIVTFIINGVICEVCFCLLALICCRGIRAQRQLEGIALGILRKCIHKLTR